MQKESDYTNRNNSLMKIQSKYILMEIFSYLKNKKLLQIIQYNKYIQKRIHKGKSDYKKEWERLEIEIYPEENKYGKFINILNSNYKPYFHIYFNDDKEEINVSYIQKCDNVNKIRVKIDRNIKSFYRLFSECHCIKRINFTVFNRNDIKNMSYMFSYCSSLNEVNLSKIRTDNVIDMKNMFMGCKSLIKLDLSNFNTNKVTTMNEMFFGCKSLLKLDLSNFNTNKVTNMNGMFFGCESLEELNISSFNIKEETNVKNMFCCCLSLKEIKCSDNKIKSQHEHDQIHYRYF